MQNIEKARYKNAQRDLNFVYANNEDDIYVLTIEEAVSIALSRNLELYVKEYEAAIQAELATQSALKMLPSLRFNSEVSGRSNILGSASRSLVPNIPPAPPSTSTDSHKFIWDLQALWNVIDFGLFYYRTRQEVNKTYIKELEYMRLQQNLVLEVIKQFWKAVVAKKAVENGKKIVDHIQEYKNVLAKYTQARVLSYVNSLTQQHRLLLVQLQMQDYQRDYDTAIAELATSLSIPPCKIIELVIPELSFIDCEQLCLEDLGVEALLNRPELFSYDIENKIWEDEVRYAVIDLLPRFSPFLTQSHDANSFLINNYWGTAGYYITWELLAIPQKLAGRCVAVKQKEYTRRKREALSLGILLQVQLAMSLVKDANKRYMIAKELEENDAKLIHILETGQKVGAYALSELITYQVDALNSEIEALKSYAEISVAIEQLNNAIGKPFHFTLKEYPCDL